MSIDPDVEMILLLPKGPNGTEIVIARYSILAPGGQIDLASMTTASVDGGVSIIVLSVTVVSVCSFFSKLDGFKKGEYIHMPITRGWRF